ncbi:unnamed protein product [Cylindrotheca closterium]|uniref:Uncharacterized protein n=1 Tax=Cylindrotheca closterium TaxID=2856 RepID=A0AAD2G1C1_9STRA|nr:unnamed protein product [Cylindrotheca closterium]
MNKTSPNNKIMDNAEPAKIHQSSDSNNMDLKSFFQKLAQDNGVKGFSLVTDHAVCQRHDVKRNSAPSVFNGATRKVLSSDAAPSCPRRRISDGDCEQTSKLLFLETIFDEVDSILHEDEEGNDDQSIDSRDLSNVNHVAQGNNEFESSFQRFIAEPLGDESRESSSRSSASLREQLVAPRLPIRKGSISEFGGLRATRTLSSCSFNTACTTAESSLEDSPMIAPQCSIELSCPASPSLQAHSWQRKEGDDYECPASAPTTRHVLDMKEIFLSPLRDSGSSHGRRRRRRSSRRNSLDTGFTFRSSFNSQCFDETDGDDILWVE